MIKLPESGLGWAVGLAHPTKPKRRLAGIWLRDMALATSGSGKQFFHHRGRRYGHVIDPRTGYPAGDLLAVTILMPSAADADACATGLFVSGSRQILEKRDLPWMPPVVMMKQGPRQDAVELESLGEIPWCEPMSRKIDRDPRPHTVGLSPHEYPETVTFEHSETVTSEDASAENCGLHESRRDSPTVDAAAGEPTTGRQPISLYPSL